MLSVYQFAFILLSWSPVTWWHDDMALVSQTAWQMAALSLPRDIMRSRECRHQHHTSTYTRGSLSLHRGGTKRCKISRKKDKQERCNVLKCWCCCECQKSVWRGDRKSPWSSSHLWATEIFLCLNPHFLNIFTGWQIMSGLPGAGTCDGL